MILGGVIEVLFGINAEGRSLESVAQPLTAVSDEGEHEQQNAAQEETQEALQTEK